MNRYKCERHGDGVYEMKILYADTEDELNKALNEHTTNSSEWSCERRDLDG